MPRRVYASPPVVGSREELLLGLVWRAVSWSLCLRFLLVVSLWVSLSTQHDCNTTNTTPGYRGWIDEDDRAAICEDATLSTTRKIVKPMHGIQDSQAQDPAIYRHLSRAAGPMRTTLGVGKWRPGDPWSSLSTCSLVVGPGLELEFPFTGNSSDQEHVKTPPTPRLSVDTRPMVFNQYRPSSLTNDWLGHLYC
ncbi:hypothetical protein FPV67DRAFT_1691598 [Lyophyllum atratum]|nr:hypothetical protein FPV67DRAFT_1691598 [Lyophyllum atratum]